MKLRSFPGMPFVATGTADQQMPIFYATDEHQQPKSDHHWGKRIFLGKRDVNCPVAVVCAGKGEQQSNESPGHGKRSETDEHPIFTVKNFATIAGWTIFFTHRT